MTCPAGPLVIDIWYREINAPDFGVLDQGWAIDTDFVNIRVWQTGPHAFCMLVKGAGTFVTVAGPSPENTDRDGIPAGIHGFYQFSAGCFSPSSPAPLSLFHHTDPLRAAIHLSVFSSPPPPFFPSFPPPLKPSLGSFFFPRPVARKALPPSVAGERSFC